MTEEATAYAKHKNLKLAAAELGIGWQILYTRLKAQGVAVVGDKLRYGTDRDKLAVMAEAEFARLVTGAIDMNRTKHQAKWDFEIRGHRVDVKASLKRQLNAKYPTLSWSFSFKKQSLVCDFIVCFCMADRETTEKILIVPAEFFQGLQTVSVSVAGGSKWLDYAVAPADLEPFFSALPVKL